MYSSSSRDYDAYLHQRNGVPPLNYPSQMNYTQSPSHSNGTMPPSNGSYGNPNLSMAPPPQFNDTAESLQRDFDQYMRDTAGSRAPFPSAAQVIAPHMQHMVHPKDHGRVSHGGQQAILPRSSRGKEPSTSSRSRSSVSKPYAKAGPAVQPAAQKDRIVVDTRALPPQVMEPGPLAPTGYVVVPQAVFYCGPTTYPPVEFMPWKWLELGNKAMRRLSAHHRVEKSFDMVLGLLREIVIKIQWPGYRQFSFETRIVIKEGKTTRGELVDLVCGAVVEFVETLKANHIKVNRGCEEWMIGYLGLKMNEFFVPRIIHRGGNYFQPEIWVPK